MFPNFDNFMLKINVKEVSIIVLNTMIEIRDDFKVGVLRYYIDELASFTDGKRGLLLSLQEDGSSNEGQLHCGWPGKATALVY